MPDELAPLFESRETRLGRLPEEARGRLTLAADSARQSGQVDFEDRQFVSLWLSRRTGLPRKEVLDNFDNITGRYFGTGATAAKAYDAISTFYLQSGTQAPEFETDAAGGQGTAAGGASGELPGSGGMPKGATGWAMQALRTLRGGVEQSAQSVAAGAYSQVAAATGFRAKDVTASPEYLRLRDEVKALQDPYQFTAIYDEPGSRMPVPSKEDEERIAAAQARMGEIAREMDEENRLGLKAWADSMRGDVSEEYRRLADFWFELSGDAMKRAGVDPAFQATVAGQFLASAGSVPVTAALAMMGPVGWAGIESLLFAEVERDRKAVEGADYDPAKALPANLAGAVPQAIIERALGIERLMAGVLRDVPKQAGKIRFGDFVKTMGKRSLASGVEEGVAEPAGGFWTDFAASITYDEQRELFSQEAIKTRLFEAAAGFALGSMFGGGMAGLQLTDQNRAVKRGAEYLTTRDGQVMTDADFRVLRQVKTDQEILAMSPDPEAGRLLIAAANGDKEAAVRYNDLVVAKEFVDTLGVEVDGFVLGERQGVPMVQTVADGHFYPIDLNNPEERALVNRIKERGARLKVAEEETAATLATMEERFGDRLDVERVEIGPSLDELVAAGTITQDQAQAAVDVAKTVNGVTQELTTGTARVSGMADIRKNADGVFDVVVKVAQAADPTVAIEEVSEGWVKAEMANQKLDPAELTAIRQRWHRDRGEADLAAGMDAATATRADIEWFSKRVIDYATATRKETLPGGWGKWLRTLGDRLKAVLRGAAQMRKLMRDGQLDPRLEELMRGALGLEQAAPTAERAPGQVQQAPQDGEPGGLMSTFSLDQFKKFPWFEEFQDVGGVAYPDGTILLYHATTQDTARKIIESGELLRPKDAPDSYGVYGSSSKAVAEDYGDGTLVAMRVKAQDVTPDDAFPGRRLDFMIKTRAGRYRPVEVRAVESTTFDPNNPDVTFALTGVPQNEEQVTQALAQRVLAKRLAASADLLNRINNNVPLPERVRRSRKSTDASLAATWFVPIATRLQTLAKKANMGIRLRRFEYDLATATNRDTAAVKPFLLAMESLPTNDARRLDLALKNGDTATRDGILRAFGMEAQFAAVEAMLNATRARAVAVGYDVGTIPDYYPRKVLDVDGLMQFYYGRPEYGAVDKAIAEATKKAADAGRSLTHEERVQIVNTVLRGYTQRDTRPGNLKARTTDVVGVDADQFYADSGDALLSYITSMNAAIEKRRFFGIHAKQAGGQTVAGAANSSLALEASIGAYVEALVANGELDRAQQREVIAILESRFQVGVMHPILNAFKSLGYITTMGHITSAMTQIGDLAFSLYENGVFDTIAAAGSAVARKSQVTRESIGLDQIAAEFNDSTKLHKALDRVFKIVGIHYLDMVGKETLMNAKLRRLQREASKGQLSKRSRDLIAKNFPPDQAAQVVADLADGNNTENVLFAAYSILADYQPINLSEYPQGYLDNPNGRIFYMLKSFTLKQFDVFRREAVSKIVSGDPKETAIGFRNLIHLSAMLFLIGMPVDWLKDFIMGRNPKLTDLAVDNLFKLIGVNRWALWRFRESRNPVESALLLIAPPAPFLVYPITDTMKSAEAIMEGDDINIGQFETWRAIPFVGSPLYWHFGGGATKVLEREKKERKKRMGGSVSR